MAKQNVAYVILFSPKGNSDSCYNVDEPVEVMMSVSKMQIMYASFAVKYLK